MKFNEGKFLLLFTGIITGILLSSFIISSPFKPTMLLTYQQYQKYNQEANELKAEIKGLYKDQMELESKLNSYDKSKQKNKSVTDMLKKELQEVKMFAEDVNVEGPGIKVIIDDRRQYQDREEIMNYITHNTDLLRVVNELQNAGAEAISINGKRFYSRTSITCEGPVIMVNGEYIVPPFEILAIGDSEALLYSLSIPESHVSQLIARGLYVSIVKKDKIKIGKLENRYIPKYIKLSK